MRSIQTMATISNDGKLIAQLPLDIPPGQHKVVVVLDDAARQRTLASASELKVLKWNSWPHNCTFRREEFYGDEGR